MHKAVITRSSAVRCWRFVCHADRQFTVRQLLMTMGDALHPDAARSTARLTALVEEGTVRRFAPGSGSRGLSGRADPSHCDAHLHLKCVGCGRLIHLDTSVSDAAGQTCCARRAHGRQAQRTTIYGTMRRRGRKRGGHK